MIVKDITIFIDSTINAYYDVKFSIKTKNIDNIEKLIEIVENDLKASLNKLIYKSNNDKLINKYETKIKEFLEKEKKEIYGTK